LSSTSAATASDLIGQVYVVADTDTNSLLVTAATKNFDRVKAILAELDRAIPQVLIKVLIAEVAHTDTLDLGVEFSAMNMNAAGTLGNEYGTDFNVSAAAKAAGSGLTFRVLKNDYTAALRILATLGKLDVLSRPYILTSDNQQASIMVGQEVPFITQSYLTDAGQTINTIQYDEVGIILTVTPHINPDGLVIMDVYPQISALNKTTTVPISTGGTGGTVNAPVFDMRAAQSRVAIRDGHTIVIGGLMQDDLQETVNKVPLLGDIPWLGALFRSTHKEKVKTELLIFLTPHVAKQPEDLVSMSENEEKNTKEIRGAIEPGAYDDQMKGMRQGGTPPAPEKTWETPSEPAPAPKDKPKDNE